MRLSEIKTPVSVLSGVGPGTVKQFANLNVWTIADLLNFFPRDYKDRTKRASLNQFETVREVHTIAQVTGHEFFGYGRMKTLKIIIRDTTARAELVCFNRPFLEKSFPVGSIVAVTGAFSVKYNTLQSSAFEIEKISDGDGHALDERALDAFSETSIPGSGIIPVYPLTEGLTQKKIIKAVQAALQQYAAGIDDELGADLIARRGLLLKKDALRKIHKPASLSDVDEARRTLSYEELFFMQKAVLRRAYKHKGALPSLDFSLQGGQDSGKKKSVEIKNEFSPRQVSLLERLPFALTADQMSVIAEMNEDIDRGYRERASLLKRTDSRGANSAQNEHALDAAGGGRTLDGGKPMRPPFTMQRLLQGDVGSGKTMVALFASLRVLDWGGQVAFMAPTEILARQHAESAARLLEPIGVRVAFLSGNIKSAGRAALLKELKNGGVDILVGTHALFSKSTVYKDLQLAIIDEQHRFGVLQRAAIEEKGRALLAGSAAGQEQEKQVYASPHLLMMSATPIPQTLALTVFGDLDVSVIKTMPLGRKPVTTYLVSEGHEENAYNAVRQEIQKGRQAYFVYPAIEGEDDDSLKSATAAFESLSQKFPQFKCALIHSKIAEENQTKILNDFRENKIQILCATTVVEVGVDVPNATCMVIEQADRFGLSQLHQLRGRVGRGSAQSYCFLIYRKNITENGIARMKALRQTTDGFALAEEDLKLRGPGEITGTAQSGEMKLGIADLSRDKDLLMQARSDALAELKAGLAR